METKAQARCRKYYKENREKIAAQQKRYRENNRKKIEERLKGYRERNHERLNVRRKEYQKENYEKFAEQYLLSRYSITMSDYEEILLAQGGKCALCGEELGDLPKGYGRHPIDHDHKGTNGKERCAREDIRGIVHPRCNLLLGLIETTPGTISEVLEKVKTYLSRNRQKPCDFLTSTTR